MTTKQRWTNDLMVKIAGMMEANPDWPVGRIPVIGIRSIAKDVLAAARERFPTFNIDYVQDESWLGYLEVSRRIT